MENFGNLKLKSCACCGERLDTVPKRDVRRVNESDLLNNINTVKPIILTNKRKVIDQVQAKIGDLICGGCRSYAKKFKNNNWQ